MLLHVMGGALLSLPLYHREVAHSELHRITSQKDTAVSLIHWSNNEEERERENVHSISHYKRQTRQKPSVSKSLKCTLTVH